MGNWGYNPTDIGYNSTYNWQVPTLYFNFANSITIPMPLQLLPSSFKAVPTVPCILPIKLQVFYWEKRRTGIHPNPQKLHINISSTSDGFLTLPSANAYMQTLVKKARLHTTNETQFDLCKKSSRPLILVSVRSH